MAAIRVAVIINASRAKSAMVCWRKTFNWVHRRLETSGRKSMNLVNGGAFHEGVAYALAMKDWDKAHGIIAQEFAEQMSELVILPGDEYKVQEHENLVHAIFDCYKQGYANEDYTVLQPECTFDVELPGTEHNCPWVHHYEVYWEGEVGMEEKWGPPDPKAILEKRIRPCTDLTCRCRVPHRLVGKTDAVIMRQNLIWLLEHKTTAIQGQQFWDQWYMDIQPTVYLYGIWKSTGMKPHGFILDSVYKPSENQVTAWNSRRKYGPAQTQKDYLKYSREPYLRTDQDLLRVERQMIDLCDEWEWRILNGKFPMENTSGACMAYNRKCDSWQPCLEHETESSFAGMQPRPKLDYVEEKLYALLPKEHAK